MTTYYQIAEQKLMYRVVSDLKVVKLCAAGRDLSGDFCHCHETITFPSKERMQEDLAKMQPATMNDWEDLMDERFGIEKTKSQMWGDYKYKRQPYVTG